MYMLYLGIALGVGKKVQKELARLNRPAALGCPAVLLDLCLTANTSHVFAERNSILTIDHIAKVFLGTRKRKSLNGLSGLVRVLEFRERYSGSGSRCMLMRED